MDLRYKKILSVLRDNGGFIRVADLAAILDVSEMTIRRDLIVLEEKKLLRRTHGGALLKNQDESDSKKQNIAQITNIERKRAIGKTAAKLIETGDSLYIDSGSTTPYLASAIKEIDDLSLAIITNSIDIAKTLSHKKDIDVIMPGGKVHTTYFSLVGPVTEDTLKKFNYSKAFLSAGGINLSNGLAILHIDEIPIKKIVVENAKQIIVMVDSTKFKKNSLISVIPFNKIDIIVTDWEIEKSYLHELEKKGIKVIVAEKE